MQAGQRLVAADGYEVALFPMPYLYMTQDEGGDYSHFGTYNIDLSGRDADGKLYNAPIYAPCKSRLVYMENSYASGNIRVFESVDYVHTPTGLRKILYYFGHDSNPPINVLGTVVEQGSLIYHTGTYGVTTADHVHTCMGYAPWISQSVSMTERPPYNHEDLTNRLHYWDTVYVNDTIIEQGFDHDWVIYDGPIPPTPSKPKSKFPWVLYARKLRERR